MLSMAPGIGRQHDPTRLVANPRPEDLAGNPSFVTSLDRPGHTIVTLSCRHCPNWVLTRDHQRLAVELASGALAGNREYRF